MENLPLFIKTELTADSFKELLPYFFEELNEDFAAMKNAYLQQNNTEIYRLAHKIKGSAASYGAILISEKARYLQEASTATVQRDLQPFIAELEHAINSSIQYAKDQF